ncbi:MAG: hypothetical protein M3017_10930 [Actinomycetota bacterium]|nr:hypothetical protein [Actinomycetota bacterium]
MDENFDLDPNDVDAVIRERGKETLNEPSLYNIAILDHLLRADVDAADIMIDSLTRLGTDQKRFLQAYLSAGSERTRFIERLTAATSGELVYLVAQVELEDDARTDFMSTALENLADGVVYRVDAKASEYLSAHYAELPALTMTQLDAEAAERIAVLFSGAGIRVPALESLSATIRSVFIEHDLYAINRDNLVHVAGSGTRLALDVLREVNEGAYRYFLGDLSAYLAAIDGVSATVDSGMQFVSVVEDVLVQDAAQVSEVVALASEHCCVPSIQTISEDAWVALAEDERFPATFENVNRYVGSVGKIDENLGKILTSAGTITEIDGAETAVKTQLAKTILAAGKPLPSAALRAGLVANLKLRNYLDVREIAAEKSELFGLLVKHDVIVDDAVTYAHLSETDWPTRARVVEESAQFKDYMTPALVRGDLAALLSRDKIDQAIKSTIVEQASQYIQGASKRDLAELARYKTQNMLQLGVDVVTVLASNGVPPQQAVVLLEPHLGALDSEHLFAILLSLGGSYSKLTSVGWEKPKVANTSADRALLEALQRHGIVNSFDTCENPIKVNKKHK